MQYEYYLEEIIEAVKGCSLNTKDAILENYDNILENLVDIFSKYKKNKQMRIFFIGNGGSAAIAIHMTADYSKNGGMTTINMYDPATITCLGNDYGYEHIFSKQLEKHIKKGDMLVAISSSGNSANILKAIDSAKMRGAVVITFTGFNANNEVRQIGDYNLYVPNTKYGIVESVHNIILQQIVDIIR